MVSHGFVHAERAVRLDAELGADHGSHTRHRSHTEQALRHEPTAKRILYDN